MQRRTKGNGDELLSETVSIVKSIRFPNYTHPSNDLVQPILKKIIKKAVGQVNMVLDAMT